MIERNECFSYDDPATFDSDENGLVQVSDYIGKVRLPADYVEFMQQSNGVSGFDCDAFFKAAFPSGSAVFEFDYISHLFGMLRGNQIATATSELVTEVAFPDGWISIGECDSDDAGQGYIMMCIDEKSAEYGAVAVALVSFDKWGKGDNTHGLGKVAPSFTAFMTGFKPQDEL